MNKIVVFLLLVQIHTIIVQGTVFYGNNVGCSCANQFGNGLCVYPGNCRISLKDILQGYQQLYVSHQRIPLICCPMDKVVTFWPVISLWLPTSRRYPDYSVLTPPPRPTIPPFYPSYFPFPPKDETPFPSDDSVPKSFPSNDSSSVDDPLLKPPYPLPYIPHYPKTFENNSTEDPTGFPRSLSKEFIDILNSFSSTTTDGNIPSTANEDSSLPTPVSSEAPHILDTNSIILSATPSRPQFEDFPNIPIEESPITETSPSDPFDKDTTSPSNDNIDVRLGEDEEETLISKSGFEDTEEADEDYPEVSIKRNGLSARKCKEFSQNFTSTSSKGKSREFPHMAAIGMTHSNYDDGGVDFVCGGSLISERFVLTSARCFATYRPNFVRLGAFDLYSNDGKDYGIAAIHKHPEYRINAIYNDIALIELDKDVEFGRDIRPACLNDESDSNSLGITTTGWGHTIFGDGEYDTLQKVPLTLVRQKDCSLHYPQGRTIERGIVKSLICAESNSITKNPCQGDLGGPLSFFTYDPNISVNIYYIVGVMSHGKQCGRKIPAVYTKVYSYLDWIEGIAFA